ncbi:MAG TPA: anti-sigma F factor antagonist [Syntrophomonas sp.]|nr:anti-sigma F factor antagonist [Syntrophomonas sp.]
MDLELKLVRNTLVVRIKGELDMLVAEKLRREIDNRLDNREINTLVINLDQVTFIDSSGLGVIIGRYKRISAGDGKMYIVGARPAVEKILFFSGINKLIPMFNSEQDIINL